jgi:hypothetical protein
MSSVFVEVEWNNVDATDAPMSKKIINLPCQYYNIGNYADYAKKVCH